MKEGDVVLTPIPQADGLIKNRPVILLRELPPYKDFLVCGISIQLDKEVKGFDELISQADDDFESTGLRTAHWRMGFLAVLPRRESSDRSARFLRLVVNDCSSHLAIISRSNSRSPTHKISFSF